MTSPHPIDLAFLGAQTFNDPALAADLLALFHHQTEEARLTLAATEASTRDRLATLHRIRGSAQAVGAGRLAAAAERAEAALRAADAPAASGSAAALAALDEALHEASAFAANRLGAIHPGGLAKRPESR